MLLKCCNVCVFTGGGKIPPRIRKYQNRVIIIPDKISHWSDNDIIDCLDIISGEEVYPMSSTTIKRLNG